jgi:hypothetical protein
MRAAPNSTWGAGAGKATGLSAFVNKLEWQGQSPLAPYVSPTLNTLFSACWWFIRAIP